MKTIAAFDFDGTLTTHDTLMQFLKFVFTKQQLAIGLIRLAPILIGFKLKLIKNNAAKEMLFSYFFKGMTLEAFNTHSKAFSARVGQLLNPKAMARLKWHQEQGHTCIIVSASIENWIMPWAAQHQLQVASTRMVIADGKITGKFLGENCYGDEKVARILELFPDRGTYTLYAYGDSSGDTAMLKLADHSFYRKFE